MKKLTLVIIAVGMFGFSGIATAGQPGEPGCFGQDRAMILHGGDFIGLPPPVDNTDPGASAWGAIAGDRAATNGELNRDYMESSCEGTPS